MAKRTRRSREAMGNLAHALKTQLALLSQAADKPQAGNPEYQTSLREIGKTMQDIVERELKRARLLGTILPGSRVELQYEVARLVQTLKKMYADKQITIHCEVENGATYGGDKEDMLELLGNLLDNACKWCDKTVRVEIRDTNGLLLIVEDDGPGCQTEIGALTRRGSRLDESKPGSGLGLAIVMDIVGSYEGKIKFLNSPELKGLRVEVQLLKVTANAF